jgi:hypothetical protein
MKRSRLKKGSAHKKKRLVTTSVYKDWKKVEIDAIKKGFIKSRKGGFYEVSVPVAVDGEPVYLSVDISSKAYDMALKNHGEEVDYEDDESRERFDNSLVYQLKEGMIPADEVIQVYIFSDEVKDLKVAVPDIRMREHWNTAFKFVHRGDFSKIRNRIIAVE